MCLLFKVAIFSLLNLVKKLVKSCRVEEVSIGTSICNIKLI